MTFHEIIEQLVKQIDNSLAFPILQKTEESIDEIVFESHVGNTHYYLVRSRSQFELEHSTHLSPREQAIARLVAQGLPNKLVGKHLGISRWTVATHLKRIYKKLGVTSRAAMTSKLVEQKLS
ncbi:MAG: helix-turn-helix transcriptional regulator [Oscillatoriales cyanobacterium SM2_3_0]|nr:helix-turn-helix transcriptional regulator [Oscillatoriales cyanobacterium SM2_3_0]